LPPKKSKLPKQLGMFSEELNPPPQPSKSQLQEVFLQTKGLSKAPPVKRRGGDCKIYYKTDSPKIQRSLISPLAMSYPDWVLPPITYPSWDKNDQKAVSFERAKIALIDCLNSALPETLLGLDFEFYPETLTPTIVGVSTPTHAYSCKWDDDLKEVFYKSFFIKNLKFSGHFVLGADRKVIEKQLGKETPLESWDDSMIRHYLCYANLCKNPGGKYETEGAMGFMGLGTAAHLWLGLYLWKNCRGVYCTGPCPRCSVFSYCAVDSYAGLMISLRAKERMRELNIPEYIYNEHSYLASEFCIKAEERGIKVDILNLEKTDKEIEDKKNSLFPANPDGSYTKFNPRSNIQVLAYFRGKGLNLKDNTKDTLRDKATLIAEDYGFETLNDFLSAPELPELSDLEQDLVNLFIFKDSGKGVEPWFGPKYLDKKGFIHSRYNFTGTSTLRYSSSRPNFTNIGARGWGKALKRLVIPRDEKLQILSADSSNLEARNCFHYAGIDVTSVGDVFSWLVENSGGILESVAKELGKTPRDVAKTVFHATNYLVGITLLDDLELINKYNKDLIKSGALLVFPDWKYFGKTVAFTGVKLAQMVFKNKTNEARKKILDLQSFYFKTYPQIREWHRDVLARIERDGCIQTAWGTYLNLLDSPLKAAKAGVAKLGQGSGAEYVQGKMYEYCKKFPETPLIAQVHDELLWEVPKSWDDLTILKFCDILTKESHRIPGFRTPWTVKVGPNLGDLREIKKNFTGINE